MLEQDDFDFTDDFESDAGSDAGRQSGEYAIVSPEGIEVMETPPESGKRLRLSTPEDFRRGAENARRQAARMFALAPAVPEEGEAEYSGLILSGDPFNRANDAA